MSDAEPSRGELILYSTEDGQAKFSLRAEGGTVWLTQAEIATLFQTTPQNITQHVKAIYSEGELTEEATCKSYLHVQPENSKNRKFIAHSCPPTDAVIKALQAIKESIPKLDVEMFLAETYISDGLVLEQRTDCHFVQRCV